MPEDLLARRWSWRPGQPVRLTVIEAHYGREAAGRVDEAVALDTDDTVWEASSRRLRLHGKAAVAANDRQIFRTIKNIH
jgi:hypothetical protein